MEVKYDDNFIDFIQGKLKSIKEIIKQKKIILKNIIEDINKTLNNISKFENVANSFEDWAKNITKYKPEENQKNHIKNNTDFINAFEGYILDAQKIINKLSEYKQLYRDNYNLCNNLIFFKGLPIFERKLNTQNKNIDLDIPPEKNLTPSDIDKTETRERKLGFINSYNDNSSNNIINLINEDEKEEKNFFFSIVLFVINKRQK